jgi:hypothetical protein
MVNRGYVFCSAFLDDAQADEEFRAKNPRVSSTRIVPFLSGRYERVWVGKVVALGNAAGFVEPLESSSLSIISDTSRLLAECLSLCNREPTPTLRGVFNRINARAWDSIRDSLLSRKWSESIWAHHPHRNKRLLRHRRIFGDARRAKSTLSTKVRTVRRGAAHLERHPRGAPSAGAKRHERAPSPQCHRFADLAMDAWIFPRRVRNDTQRFATHQFFCHRVTPADREVCADGFSPPICFIQLTFGTGDFGWRWSKA